MLWKSRMNPEEATLTVVVRLNVGLARRMSSGALRGSKQSQCQRN